MSKSETEPERLVVQCALNMQGNLAQGADDDLFASDAGNSRASCDVVVPTDVWPE